jgi:hypothetical protein
MLDRWVARGLKVNARDDQGGRVPAGLPGIFAAGDVPVA